MKIKSFLCAGIAVLGCLVGCTPKEDVKVPDTLEISGVDASGLTFDANGGTKTVTVKSNVAWTATSNVDWLTITPNSAEAKDEAAAISVKIKAVSNTATESRTAVVTVTVTDETLDIEPIIVNVAQNGEEKALSVWNIDTYAPYENYALNVDYAEGTSTFTVHSNVNWKVTGPDWVTVTPAENTYDGENVNVEVSVAYAANAGDAKTGELVFIGDGVTLTVPVSQAKVLSFTLTNETEEAHAYIDADINVAQSGGLDGVEHYWYYACASDAVLEKRGGVEGLINFYLTAYSTYYGDYELANLFYSEGKVLQFGELTAETNYTVAVYGVDKNANNEFVLTTEPAVLTFTTAKAPAADEAYLNFIGTYAIDVIDFYNSETDDDYNIVTAVRDTITLNVAQAYINESYTFTFPDGTVAPVTSRGVTDEFEAGYDATNKEINFYNGQYGSQYWSFSGVDEYCQIVFFSEWFNSTEEVVSSNFKLSDDKNQLILTIKSQVENDNLYFGSSVYGETSEESYGGYGLYLFDEKSIPTRVVEESTPSSVSADELGINAKNDKIRGIKANGKLHRNVIR